MNVIKDVKVEQCWSCSKRGKGQSYMHNFSFSSFSILLSPRLTFISVPLHTPFSMNLVRRCLSTGILFTPEHNCKTNFFFESWPNLHEFVRFYFTYMGLELTPVLQYPLCNTFYNLCKLYILVLKSYILACEDACIAA